MAFGGMEQALAFDCISVNTCVYSGRGKPTFRNTAEVEWANPSSTKSIDELGCTAWSNAFLKTLEKPALTHPSHYVTSSHEVTGACVYICTASMISSMNPSSP